MTDRSQVQISGDRLWASLMEMARVGATPNGGSCRLALTDADREGRELFLDWVAEAGYSWRLDELGNLFIRRPGQTDNLLPIVIGSHLDTQPTGGRFDGVLGVLAGLEVMRTLDEHDISTQYPLEIAVWLNEEGSRFSPPMMGSGVWAGALTKQQVLDTVGQDSARLGDELQRHQWVGDTPADHRSNPLAGYLELHIEQGPILEDAGEMIGVITGAQAQRWYEITLTGREAHAGTTPMRLRRDALVGAARIVDAVYEIGHRHRDAVSTIGVLDVYPDSRNVIPGKTFLTADMRHPDETVLRQMRLDLEAECHKAADDIGLACSFRELWHSPVQPFDANMVDHVRNAAKDLGYQHRDMVSGAGHDAVHVANVCPTAMIFVPCKDGVSHNEAESITPEQAEAGCAVLFKAALAAAGKSE